MGTADLHIHTRHGDGMATVAEILDHVERATDIDIIAITEHDTPRPALEARELHARGTYRFNLIPGIEVTTLDGHLLALFVDEPIASFRRKPRFILAVVAPAAEKAVSCRLPLLSVKACASSSLPSPLISRIAT